MNILLKYLKVTALGISFYYTGLGFSVATIASQSVLRQSSSGKDLSLIAQSVNPKTADQLFNEGFKLYQQGTAQSLVKAIPKFKRALSLYQKLGELNGQGIVISYLGKVYSSLGQYAKAIDYYQQSLVIFKEIGDRNGEAAILNNLGEVYSSLGQ